MHVESMHGGKGALFLGGVGEQIGLVGEVVLVP